MRPIQKIPDQMYKYIGCLQRQAAQYIQTQNASIKCQGYNLDKMRK